MSEAGPANFNERVITEFRANGGKVGPPFEGMPMVLLTTVGAKSGKSRTTPLVYLPDGERIVIIASKGGAPTNPDWFHNVLADPEVTVEVGTESYQATAVRIEGAERDEVYARVVEMAPGFGEYQEKTSRVIPLFALYRKQD
ncbi:nitroreductase family deazaflavin-dependent oxidoreductase [Amycolatopsis nigrescens]|uniref:nitroreductase family deazaflavin-dependent oxidoreductase n=1 Tax=Amycolatopsis nigrescens TaxID=381445 RepID=UPI0003659437|nr:nitroreductase family deazaflavin-dependent oxidoreductase [Amycolatopsis nigrescens]